MEKLDRAGIDALAPGRRSALHPRGLLPGLSPQRSIRSDSCRACSSCSLPRRPRHHRARGGTGSRARRRKRNPYLGRDHPLREHRRRRRHCLGRVRQAGGRAGPASSRWRLPCDLRVPGSPLRPRFSHSISVSPSRRCPGGIRLAGIYEFGGEAAPFRESRIAEHAGPRRDRRYPASAATGEPSGAVSAPICRTGCRSSAARAVAAACSICSASPPRA